MDLQIFDASGKQLGNRQLPQVPRQGDVILMPVPYPDDARTAAEIHRAQLATPQPYEVVRVIWDSLAKQVKLIVQQTTLPPNVA